MVFEHDPRKQVKRKVSDAIKCTQFTSLPEWEQYGSGLLWGDERQEMESLTHPRQSIMQLEPRNSTLRKIITHKSYFAKIEKYPISMFHGSRKKKSHLKRTNFLSSISELGSDFAEFAKKRELNFTWIGLSTKKSNGLLCIFLNDLLLV